MKINFKKIVNISVLSMAMAMGLSAQASTLEQVQSKGVLKVGVKTDYRPFGFLDSNGNIVGIEPDLAAALAEKLGVKVELVPVQTANRIEFLQQGRIDAMIATLSSNEQRERILNLLQPYYYAGGTAVILPKGSGVTSWSDLRGKKICGTQGAYYNRSVAQKYGAEIVAFPGSTEAQAALLTGSCEGFLQDSTLLTAMLADPSGRWANYEVPLPVEDWQMWAIALQKSTEGTPLEAALVDVITDWHKTGYLLKKEQEWGLTPSAFLEEQHEKFKNK